MRDRTRDEIRPWEETASLGISKTFQVLFWLMKEIIIPASVEPEGKGWLAASLLPEALFQSQKLCIC